MAYFYKDQNFQGPYLHMETGTVYGKYMLGCPARSTYCDEIAGEIKSVRIEQNTIAMISDSVSLYNGHSQVLIGPMSISHNTFNIQSILVTRYKDYDFVTPAPGPLVTLCNNLSMVGMQYHLYMGDYSYHRLMSEEIKIDPKNILSMQIAPNVILIVEADNKTILLRGPKTINDLQEVGLSNSVIHSLKVKYSPPDTNVVDRAYDKIMSWDTKFHLYKHNCQNFGRYLTILH